jgi:hypothetical protein
MEIVGTITAPQQDNDPNVDMAEMQRLGLDKQYKRFAVDHRDKTTDEYPIYLAGDGTLMLHFQHLDGCVMLDRAEVCRLYTFFDQPHIQELMINILRANLIEAGHGDLIDELMSMPDDHKQAFLWAFGRADKPAFLNAAA